ncbi:MAG: glucosyl-3-phosphoglycerate phosphatase [Micromonosporaceae bacterium]|nr:glucosyl-3-phosphoglycerate phosphatase [Micromonosporaceae bacterium]
MTRLLLWRHGQTTWNAAGRVQGQLDGELSEVGREQAGAVAARLVGYHPDMLVTSDLRRAADTAAALAALTGLAVGVDARLRERHHGVWQGLTTAEIATRWPEQYHLWRTGKPVPGLGVEDVEGVGKRMVDALQDAAGRAPGGTVVLVSHGAAIRRAVITMLGWPVPVAATLGVMANCHWAELRLDPDRGWQLRSYNAS